jgi:hypothetical protein
LKGSVTQVSTYWYKQRLCHFTPSICGELPGFGTTPYSRTIYIPVGIYEQKLPGREVLTLKEQ